MIQINKNPSRKELAWFGLLALVFFGIVGGIVLRRTGSMKIAEMIWIIAAIAVAVYYAMPPLRRPVYVGAMMATYPIGWVMSHLLMAAVYYLVLTPIALIMRLVGHDSLSRNFDRQCSSYWIPHDPGVDSDRYFRQS